MGEREASGAFRIYLDQLEPVKSLSDFAFCAPHLYFLELTNAGRRTFEKRVISYGSHKDAPGNQYLHIHGHEIGVLSPQRNRLSTLVDFAHENPRRERFLSLFEEKVRSRKKPEYHFSDEVSTEPVTELFDDITLHSGKRLVTIHAECVLPFSKVGTDVKNLWIPYWAQIGRPIFSSLHTIHSS